MQPQTVVAIVTIGTVGSLTGINIYKKSREIAEKSREPASPKKSPPWSAPTQSANVRAISRRLKSAFTITNVVLPVYFDTHTSSNNHQTSTGIKKSDLRKLVIDFTFVSSNKYIRSFFWDDNNTYLIMDRLNTTIEPIAIEFPLEEEGKSSSGKNWLRR